MPDDASESGGGRKPGEMWIGGVDPESDRPESEWSKIIREEEAKKALDRDRLLRSVKPAERAAPRLRDEALYGPHGDYVRAVEGKTEATAPAILATLLALYGCWSGPRAWIVRGLANHGPNVSCVVVGASAHSSKGTSRGVALQPYVYAGAVDQVSAAAVPVSVGMQSSEGYASGEALIDRLSDPTHSDIRVMIFETEFASMLKRMNRDGSTLSQVTRQLYDQSRISTHSRAHGSRSVEPDEYWVGIAAHITNAELNDTLDKTHIYGGTVNRMLWFHAPKSPTTLAFEEPIPESAIRGYAAALELGTPKPPGIGVVEIAPGAATDLWTELCGTLKADDPEGLMGHVVGRNRAQVLRLAVNYMLSVGKRSIGVEELRAGAAVWDYCRASAWQIFGMGVGDPAIDALVRWMMEEEQGGQATPEELRAEFGSQYRARVERAESIGLLRRTRLATSGPGRKPIRYELVT